MKAIQEQVKNFVKERPEEIIWSVGGSIFGGILGSVAIGGTGLAPLGGVIEMGGAIVLSIIGLVLGNKIGAKRDQHNS